MPILDKTDKEMTDRYERFVAASPHRALTQDLGWAHVKDDWGNAQVYVERDGEIAAAMSLLIKKVPGGFSLLYAPRGPVCDVTDKALLAELIAEADKVAKQHKAFALKFDPEVRFSDELEQQLTGMGFKVRNREAEKEALIQPRLNMILYFDDCDEESIMMKFSKKCRNIIRGAVKKGVTVSWGDDDRYLEDFYRIYRTMAERNEITTRSIGYFKKMREAFGKNLRIYIAEHEGDQLAAGLTINYGGKMYYLYAGSTNEKRNLNPNHLMNYEMIKWGISEGAEQYDFGGVFELSPKDGLYLFKKSFCDKDGHTEYIGEADKVYKPFLYSMFVHVVPKLQKLKKKMRS
ncbi:lipid II:glycine glycyltransferase FemX [Bhargavaea ullalensis]|uniref:Lipid II:glycine glycyltransferase n=1 Tax=Bhargavaea ullalensis TaxID=1265685 RepID=A0ABV2GDA2_9BACL